MSYSEHRPEPEKPRPKDNVKPRVFTVNSSSRPLEFKKSSSFFGGGGAIFFFHFIMIFLFFHYNWFTSVLSVFYGAAR